jgi:hypothetical protein
MQGTLSYLLQFGATMLELEELQVALHEGEIVIPEENVDKGSIFSEGEQQ